MNATLDSVEKEYRQVQEDLGKVRDQVQKHAEETLKEVKNLGDTTKQTKEAADKALSEFNALNAKFKDLQQRLERPQGEGIPTVQSVGACFVNSEEARGKLSSSFKGNIRVSMPRAALTSATVNVPAQTNAEIVTPPLTRLTVRDLLLPGTTSSNSIEFTQETGFTNKAAPVAEGAQKPYSEINTALKNAPVRTIAHMFKASRQIMDDVPALQSYIDGRARYGLMLAEEKQLLMGDGTGANILGIIPQATAFEVPGGVTVASATQIDTIRLALLQAVLAEFPASGIVLNQIDWAVIETLKDANGRYIIGNPQGSIAKTLWNVPVVDTPSQAPKSFLVGAFNIAAQIYDRMSIEVLLSTENVDDFEKNMVSIRAEERLALAVYRPEAFVAGTFS